MITPDVKLAFDALVDKQNTHSTFFSYYDGDQPLIYSTERLKEAFNNLNARFNQNWCAVIVDSVLDRISLKGWTVQSEAENLILSEIWDKQHLQLEAFDAHQAAEVTGESFIIIEESDLQPSGLEIFYNDPRLCHMFYDSANPKVKRMACKWWQADDKKYYLNLYYPDRIEHWVTRSTMRYQPTSATQFVQLIEPAADVNPFEPKIPVFHLRTSRRVLASGLVNAITIQDAVNKLLSDMMVAAEFGAFKQRWLITNADTTGLKNSPNEIWSIPPDEDGKTQVGQFDATDLTGYLAAMDKLANSLATITRTPKPYFVEVGSGISGDALIAMEAPLTKKVGQREENYGVTWQEIGAFILNYRSPGTTVAENQIKPTWKIETTVQPVSQATARKTSVEAGIPLKTELRREGWSEPELDQLDKDAKEAKKEQTSTAQALLDKLRAEDAQQNPPGSDQQNQPTKQPVMGNNNGSTNNPA